MSASVSLVDPWFLAAIAGVACVRALVAERHRLTAAVILSGALVGLASWQTLATFLFVSLAIVHPLSKWIARCRERSPGRAGVLFWAGVCAVLASWIACKTSRQFVLPGTEGGTVGAELASVVGFSYLIFRAIDVLHIHYLGGDVQSAGALHVLYYSLFPATLTSGPIQKYSDFCREVATQRRVGVAPLAVAAERITTGFFFKVCLAPILQSASDRLLEVQTFHAWHTLALMFSMYLFVYFDFAGYTHIAIGLGALLGVSVPENFRSPFLATSVTEFWRHWHITIGDWFRDHVFIPLGGMRTGGARAACIAAGIMFACGLWHGFTTLFVAWGAWHGLILLVDGLAGVRPMPPAARRGLPHWTRVGWTNLRIAFGALFFLPSWSVAKPVMEGLLRWW